LRYQQFEDGIARFYELFQLSPEHAAKLHAGVLDELAADREQAAYDAGQARKRIDRLQGERKKLLAAHYAGAIPLDMLGSEMERMTSEITDAEAAAVAATRSVADLEGTLREALAVAANCAGAYLASNAKPAV
jgi:site-specific DNA recombinase